MTKRTELFKEYVVNTLNNAGVRYTTMYDMIGQSLKSTVGEHNEIRRAKVNDYLYQHIPLVVHPYEKLIGSQLGMYPVDEHLPDYDERKKMARAHLLEYRQKRIDGEANAYGGDIGELPRAGSKLPIRFALISRDNYEANIPYDELQRLIHEMQDEFKDDEYLVAPEISREIEQMFCYYYEEGYKYMNEMTYEVGNHLGVDHGRLLQRGFGSLKAQAEQGLADAKAIGDSDKERYYTAAIIVADAAIAFIRRYADFTEAEAGRCEDEARAAQLREAAAIMRKIAAGKPESFKEAMQLLWLEFIMLNIPGGNAESLTLFDQYMYPFYKHDIDNGIITREEAKEYISDLWIKVNEPKMRTVISMTLGGTTPDGKPGENELTSLCLEVLRDIRTPFPNTGVRVRHDTPEWVYDDIVKTLECGVGQPMIINDDHWIPAFTGLGYALEDAREYFNQGCVEMMMQGMQPTWRYISNVNFATAIELVFSNGKAATDGSTGIQTGELETLDTFEKFLDAACKQTSYQISYPIEHNLDASIAHLEKLWDPFCSLLMRDPLDRGADMYHFGTRYTAGWVVGGSALGTATDSLSAVKKFVYDEKIISLAELRDVLANNFAGREDLRIMLERTTPSFGNDIDEVDEMAKALIDAFYAPVAAANEKYKDTPWRFITSHFSYTSQVYYGELVGAMPNGRLARTNISDNAGPSQGKDIGGPTKLVNSMLKKGYEKVTGAYAFNMKFTPSVMKTNNGRAAMKNIIKRYFAGNGPQIQVNYVDSKTLREAQKDPKKYEGLIVRVAGFCEYFANLDRELQNEIIDRTEQGM